ncbi:MAG: N-acetylneuraminate synthase family protein [Candidatus Marinimicrobia bacterium]|nr:N-acetylneuraminate synthase family protein [Candidatus Neomarinimicrobiota bacterium]
MKKLTDYGFNTDNRVYIIAEIGINHGGDLDVAKQLILSAARTGADAVKFQTYITEKRVAKDSPIFDILKTCELSFDACAELKDYAKEHQIDWFSTPFDDESVDFLQSIDTALYKIASFDVVNHKILLKIAQTRKPLIMSVGMSSAEEIDAAYRILKKVTGNIALLHCISAYPTDEKDANLAALKALQQRYDCVIGQSDHTDDILVPLYAVAGGAQILEKHYKLDDNMDCIDAPVSISEEKMAKLVVETRRLETILGQGDLGVRTAEEGTVQYRRYSS